jgi:hypothetical protein
MQWLPQAKCLEACQLEILKLVWLQNLLQKCRLKNQHQLLL